MSGMDKVIQITVGDEPDSTYDVTLRDAETLALQILKKVGASAPDLDKELYERSPMIVSDHPGFIINTNALNEIYVTFSTEDFRPIKFTMTEEAATSLRDGLTHMLDRVAQRGGIKKQ